MGEEEFYTLVYPIIAWVLDARLGRLMALLMAISFYVTGKCSHKTNLVVLYIKV